LLFFCFFGLSWEWASKVNTDELDFVFEHWSFFTRSFWNSIFFIPISYRGLVKFVRVDFGFLFRCYIFWNCFFLSFNIRLSGLELCNFFSFFFFLWVISISYLMLRANKINSGLLELSLPGHSFFTLENIWPDPWCSMSLFNDYLQAVSVASLLDLINLATLLLQVLKLNGLCDLFFTFLKFKWSSVNYLNDSW